MPSSTPTSQLILTDLNRPQFSSTGNRPPQSPRKRAHRACFNCRFRRVRCDATLSNDGQHCTNCRLDGKICVVSYEKRRVRRPKRTQVQSHARVQSRESTVTTGIFAPTGDSHSGEDAKEIKWKLSKALSTEELLTQFLGSSPESLLEPEESEKLEGPGGRDFDNSHEYPSNSTQPSSSSSSSSTSAPSKPPNVRYHRTQSMSNSTPPLIESASPPSLNRSTQLPHSDLLSSLRLAPGELSLFYPLAGPAISSYPTFVSNGRAADESNKHGLKYEDGQNLNRGMNKSRAVIDDNMSSFSQEEQYWRDYYSLFQTQHADNHGGPLGICIPI